MSNAVTEYDKLFIGGRWAAPSTSEVIEAHCPATGEYVGKVPPETTAVRPGLPDNAISRSDEMLELGPPVAPSHYKSR